IIINVTACSAVLMPNKPDLAMLAPSRSISANDRLGVTGTRSGIRLLLFLGGTLAINTDREDRRRVAEHGAVNLLALAPRRRPRRVSGDPPAGRGAAPAPCQPPPVPPGAPPTR